MKRQKAAALRTREISRGREGGREGVQNRGKDGETEERRGGTELQCVGRCFLCHCSPILSPENVTLPLGGSAPRRDSSV